MLMYEDELSKKIIKWLQEHHKEEIITIMNTEDLHKVSYIVEENFVKSINSDDYWTIEDKEKLSGETLTTNLSLVTTDGHEYFIRLVNLARQ